MSYDVLHSGCNPSDHSVILAKFAINFKRTLYKILCAHIMCTYYVHMICAQGCLVTQNKLFGTRLVRTKYITISVRWIPHCQILVCLLMPYIVLMCFVLLMRLVLKLFIMI